MKKLIILFCMSLLPLFIWGQNDKELKLVKLKSGIKISGYVTTEADGSINLTTPSGDRFGYHSSEVSSIETDPSIEESRRQAEEKAREEALMQQEKEKEEAKQKKAQEKEAARLEKEKEKEAARLEKQKALIASTSEMKGKGFQCVLETGCTMSSYWAVPYFTIIPGYRFNKYLFLGGSLGILKYSTAGHSYHDDYDVPYYSNHHWEYDSIESAIYIDAGLYLRYNILQRRSTPYLAFRLGGAYDVSAGTDYYYDEYGVSLGLSRFRPFIGVDLGWMFRTRRGGGFHIGMGPKLVAPFHYDFPWEFGFKLGWTF